MRATMTFPLMCLALAALVLTSGCEGLNAYRSEAAAQAACPNDEVVYGWFDTGGLVYVTKASPQYGTSSYGQGGDYACLADMIRYKATCGAWHNYDEGPLPSSLVPECYNVPGKPKT